jgi:hypothetical protein
MSPTSTYLVAHERINELLREGEQARRAGELRSSRRAERRSAGKRAVTRAPSSLLLRLGGLGKRSWEAAS